MKTYQAGLMRDPNNATLLNEKRTLEMALDKLQRGKEHLAAVSVAARYISFMTIIIVIMKKTRLDEVLTTARRQH